VSAAETQLEVAVVGVGHLGRHHARLWSMVPGVRLVAVADLDLDRARAVAAACGCEAVRHGSELIGRVQAASVAVPTRAHAEVAIPLLEAGVDVLIEKPIAATLEEADAINAAAARRSRLVMVGHSERFHPAVIALSREVRAPRFFEIHRLAAFSARSIDIDVVLDLMIHDLDLLLALDGSPPVAIEAVGLQALTDRVDIANARIRFESGCVANVTASRISVDPVRRIRVFQERTYLSCDTVAGQVERYRLIGAPGGASIERALLPIPAGEPLGLELAAFAAAVRERRPPPVDGTQGRRALELAFRIGQTIAAG
jgi:predicted dehydrogenase